MTPQPLIVITDPGGKFVAMIPADRPDVYEAVVESLKGLGPHTITVHDREFTLRTTAREEPKQ